MNNKPDNINKFSNVLRSPLKLTGLVAIVLIFAGIATAAWTYTTPPLFDCVANGTCYFGNMKLNETTLIAQFFQGDASNLTAVPAAQLTGTAPLAAIPATLTGKDADTVDGYHLNQGVRTTDSPAFVNITGNVSGQNVSAKKIGGIIYADQYATLQDALNVSRDAGSGIVFLQAGTNNITSIPLKIYNNTILRGAGNTTIIRLNDSTYVGGSETNFIQNSCAAPSPTCTNYGIQIEDLQIDANKAGQTGLQANDLYGINLHWASGTKITNIGVRNAYSSGIGVWPSNSATKIPSETIITGVTAVNNGGGQSLDGGILISNGTSEPVRVTVSNSITKNNYNGIVIEDSKGGVSLVGNHAYNNTEAGILFQTTYHATATGNTIKYNKNGIDFDGTGERFISLTGNVIEENSEYGILLKGHDVVMTANQINWNNYSGIYWEAYNSVAIGNSIQGNGVNASAPNRAGIYIVTNFENNNIISGNLIGRDYYAQKLTDSQQYGIQEGNAIDGPNLYTQNNFYGNNVSGILQNSSSVTAARQNMRISPFDFGNKATAPSDVGFGNTYKNSTSGDGTCYATGSEYRNATGNTVVC